MHLDVHDLAGISITAPSWAASRKGDPRPGGGTLAGNESPDRRGYGFAVPLLRPYLDQARRVIMSMPGPQGVMPWPAGLPNALRSCARKRNGPWKPGWSTDWPSCTAGDFGPAGRAFGGVFWRVLGPGGAHCSSCRTGPGFGRAPMQRPSVTGGPIRCVSLTNCSGNIVSPPNVTRPRCSRRRPIDASGCAPRRHVWEKTLTFPVGRRS